MCSRRSLCSARAMGRAGSPALERDCSNRCGARHRNRVDRRPRVSGSPSTREVANAPCSRPSRCPEVERNPRRSGPTVEGARNPMACKAVGQDCDFVAVLPRPTGCRKSCAQRDCLWAWIRHGCGDGVIDPIRHHTRGPVHAAGPCGCAMWLSVAGGGVEDVADPRAGPRGLDHHAVTETVRRTCSSCPPRRPTRVRERHGRRVDPGGRPGGARREGKPSVRRPSPASCPLSRWSALDSEPRNRIPRPGPGPIRSPHGS
jgi:hypothetical protein